MELMESTNGLLLFLAYLGTAAALTLAYIVIYMWVTPHPEIALIRQSRLSVMPVEKAEYNLILKMGR